MTELYHPVGEDNGLLLLDYFAAEAMKAFIINKGTLEDMTNEYDNTLLVKSSYILAQKMLEERKSVLKI